MIVFAFGFLLGVTLCAWKPSFAVWARGVAGKARDVFFGARPVASATTSAKWVTATATARSGSDQVSRPPANNPIRAGEAAKNILAFFGGLLAWMAKNPIPTIAIVLLALFLIFGRSCVRLPQLGDLFKSRDTIIAERDNANTNTGVAEHETNVANRGVELAEETRRDARRREDVIAQAEQEFADAVSQADFDRLHSAYERATAGVWSGFELESEPDHSSRGSDPVRRSGADSA